jgi:hypothetical protein
MKQPEPSIVRELNAVSPGMYPKWNPQSKRWMLVRKYDKRVGGITYYDPIEGQHYIVEMILEDQFGRAIELCPQAVTIVRQLLQEKDRYSAKYPPAGFSCGFNYDKFEADEQAQEEKRIREARTNRLWMQREFFKKVWTLTKTHTVT